MLCYFDTTWQKFSNFIANVDRCTGRRGKVFIPLNCISFLLRVTTVISVINWPFHYYFACSIMFMNLPSPSYIFSGHLESQCGSCLLVEVLHTLVLVTITSKIMWIVDYDWIDHQAVHQSCM